MMAETVLGDGALSADLAPQSSMLTSAGSNEAILDKGNVRRGALIINADDWGRDRKTTDRTLDGMRQRTVSSVSAMVFMEDSERAAEIARESDVDAGLHLNFSAPFTAGSTPAALVDRHNKIAAYLLIHPLARVMFHPGLTNCFEYSVRTQLEEFSRLYHREPNRVDGHHHLHLCANVLFAELLPAGTIARRNFSFHRGEKNLANRCYRKMIDAWLGRRHRLVDFLFALAPLRPLERIERIFKMAQHSTIEVETHPVNSTEYEFLMNVELFTRSGWLPARKFEVFAPSTT